MKTLKIFRDLLIMLLCMAPVVIAGVWAVNAHAHAQSNSDYLIKFMGGWVTAYALHEGSHAVAGAVTGTDLDWKFADGDLRYSFSTTDAIDGKLICSSGLMGQLIASEFVLQNEKIDRSKPFVQGFMFWNIANPVLYSLDYFFLHRNNREYENGFSGDIQGMEYYGGKQEARIFAGSMITLSLINAYRWYKPESKLNSLYFTPVPGGAEFGYRIEF
jgi:hypothetical protein